MLHTYLAFCLALSSLVFASQSATAQRTQSRIDPAAVTIARDSYGVPHIFAKTDAEVAYGLAWAHAEDNFKTIQQLVLPAKGMLGRHLGKKGAAADYVVELVHAPEVVAAADYVVELVHAPEVVAAAGDTALSPDFRAVVEGYLQGLNDYARTHPQEVLVKRSFPITLTDYLRTAVLSLSVISGVEKAITDILNGKVAPAPVGQGGSNAFAFHRSRTTDSTTYLAINSHQPLEGPVAWYEAHLCSEQGWNIIGGLFPGGVTVFHGANEHLGWAHTVNYQDKIDTYQLQTDKAHPGQYFFDNQWLPLEVKKVKLRVKGIPFAIGRKAYYSKYGPTIVTKAGRSDVSAFALRFGANQDLRGLEQWYRMNKATSFADFRRATAKPSIPGFNIVYADADTIFFVTNGKIPYRDPAYNWLGTLPGNTSRTLWTKFRPLADFPQLTNPKSGYVFNMNNTPFNATAPDENLRPEQFDVTMGFERWNTNRSTRFGELMAERAGKRIDYADFKRIKYDLQFPATIAYPSGPDITPLFSLNAATYPDIREQIETLTTWNRQATADSRGAALYGIFYYYMVDKLKNVPSPKATLTADDCAEGLRFARTYLMKYFRRTQVTLGDYQQHVRGSKEVPVWGLPDVLAAIGSVPYKNAAGQTGRVRSAQGESYIMLARFPKTGLPVLETVNCFGASARPDSPHFTDQMELFTQMKTKPMTLDKAAVLRDAKRTYHPGE